MTFADYVKIIQQSVAEQGYDRFLPSMCEAGEKALLRVLECELSDTGEEFAAKEWGAEFSKGSEPMYLAYRAGNRMVHVCEIKNLTVVNKFKIHVQPYREES